MKAGDIVYRTLYDEYKDPGTDKITWGTTLPTHMSYTITDLINHRVNLSEHRRAMPVNLWEGVVTVSSAGQYVIVWKTLIGTWTRPKYRSILTAFQTLIRL